jgi:hypothetical protein
MDPRLKVIVVFWSLEQEALNDFRENPLVMARTSPAPRR